MTQKKRTRLASKVRRFLAAPGKRTPPVGYEGAVPEATAKRARGQLLKMPDGSDSTVPLPDLKPIAVTADASGVTSIDATEAEAIVLPSEG